MEVVKMGLSGLDEYIAFRRPNVTDERKKAALRKELEWYFSIPWGDGDIVRVLIADDGRPAGNVIAMPVRLHAGGKDVSGSWIIDTYTDSGYRRRGVASKIISRMAEEFEFLLAAGANRMAEGLYAGEEYVFMARFKRYAAVLNPHGFLAHYAEKKAVLKYLAPAAFLIPGPAGFKAGAGRETAVFDRFDSGFDALWEETKDCFQIVTHRTSEWLEWRFDACPHRDYTRISLHEKGALHGYLVMRWIDTEGARAGFVTDIFTDMRRPVCVKALLDAAVREARARGLDYLTVIASEPRLESTLRSLRFLPLPYHSHDKARKSGDSSLDAVLSVRENWFLTLANADYDLNLLPLEEEELFNG